MSRPTDATAAGPTEHTVKSRYPDEATQAATSPNGEAGKMAGATDLAMTGILHLASGTGH